MFLSNILFSMFYTIEHVWPVILAARTSRCGATQFSLKCCIILMSDILIKPIFALVVAFPITPTICVRPASPSLSDVGVIEVIGVVGVVADVSAVAIVKIVAVVVAVAVISVVSITIYVFEYTFHALK